MSENRVPYFLGNSYSLTQRKDSKWQVLCLGTVAEAQSVMVSHWWPMRKETIARREAEHRAGQAAKREAFERNYQSARVAFPELPADPPADRDYYWQEFQDGRAVAISATQWHEE